VGATHRRKARSDGGLHPPYDEAVKPVGRGHRRIGIGPAASEVRSFLGTLYIQYCAIISAVGKLMFGKFAVKIG